MNRKTLFALLSVYLLSSPLLLGVYAGEKDKALKAKLIALLLLLKNKKKIVIPVPLPLPLPLPLPIIKEHHGHVVVKTKHIPIHHHTVEHVEHVAHVEHEHHLEHHDPWEGLGHASAHLHVDIAHGHGDGWW